jgi:hypothetical protein
VIFLSGIVAYFVDSPITNALGTTVSNWGVVLGAYAVGLGFLTLLLFHAKNVITQKRGEGMIPSWIWSIVTIIGALSFFLTGLVLGRQDPTYTFWLTYIFSPTSTLIARLKTWFLVLSLYRALKIRDINSIALFVVFVLYLWGVSTLGLAITPDAAFLSDWIRNVLTKGVERALYIVTYLGATIFTVRLIFGRQKGWMEGGE